MEEQLELIKSQLYKSEVTFPPLRERLIRSGELRAWYRYYRGGNQWANKLFTEENIFLMSQLLIWSQIYEDGKMDVYSFKLDEISKVERDYAYEDKTNQKLVLSQAIVTFKTMKDKRARDCLVFKRPVAAEMGDSEGFERLLDLLD